MFAYLMMKRCVLIYEPYSDGGPRLESSEIHTNMNLITKYYHCSLSSFVIFSTENAACVAKLVCEKQNMQHVGAT